MSFRRVFCALTHRLAAGSPLSVMSSHGPLLTVEMLQRVVTELEIEEEDAQTAALFEFIFAERRPADTLAHPVALQCVLDAIVRAIDCCDR